MNITQILANELGIKESQVQAAVNLIDEGNTIPFIARYRKEVTGSLDDECLRNLFDRLNYLRGLEKRKEEIIASITEQEKMTDEIMKAIEEATVLSRLEDIYRPFRPKRKTRASVAKEKGLEPFANDILAQTGKISDINEEAKKYIDAEKGVESEEDAVNGAMDIIAEIISDDAKVREKIRNITYKTGVIKATASKEEDSVYATYYDFEDNIRTIKEHKILALDRGEREEFLKVSVEVEIPKILEIIRNMYVTGSGVESDVVCNALEDSYTRLIAPSIEREVRNELTDKAGEQAIKVFSVNLKNLLMQPPVKNHVILGLDPAYRTGCKIAIIDETSKVLDTTVVYPTPPQNKVEEAMDILEKLIKKHNVTVISIGNGTASRESEAFVAKMIKERKLNVSYMVVSEAGASVYSASKLASEEFPQYDVSLRSAVSIARRLADPLAELVKIDPKSIGVGQYQHDLKKNRLEESLEGVVEYCVNSVGVDLNTASVPLLSKIAGINASVAKNIVAYREENGNFKERKELLKVNKLGDKAFLQCAGFTRIPGGKTVLENTAVHPESYKATKELLTYFGLDLKKATTEDLKSLREKAENEGTKKIADTIGIGEPTLIDILSELEKPGRDPRDEIKSIELKSDVLTLEDLKVGMLLKGTVRNVIDFGAFVDIGVHDDGLVHISEIANKYIKHPSEVLSVGDIVEVVVLSVDVAKRRIGLSIKQAKESKQEKQEESK